MPVKFELTPDAHRPADAYASAFRPPPGDDNPDDNLREADVEIVDRKNHVLLLAGGPTRDYQFLRSLLYRDHSTTLDVLLQSGKPGMSQEAEQSSRRFPATRQEMFDYDCVVAFDPELAGPRCDPGRAAGKMGGRPRRWADRGGRAGVRGQGASAAGSRIPP